MIAVGAVSSSVSVIAALVTVKPVAAPLTSMVSSPSTMLSFAGVSVNVPVPDDSFAPMVTAKFDTSP